jgi:SAM-dependent methyltransferase
VGSGIRDEALENTAESPSYLDGKRTGDDMKNLQVEDLLHALRSLPGENRHPGDGIISLDICEEPGEREVREFYESYPYRQHFPTNPLEERIARYRRDWARWCLPLGLEGKRTLDVGCGCGINLAIHGALAAVAVGIDVSMAALRQAHAYLLAQGVSKRVFLTCGDIRHLPLPDGSFDVITCVGVLHHIRDHSGALAKMSALLDPKGVLLLGLYHPGGRFFHRLKRKISNLGTGKNAISRVKRAQCFFNIEKEANRYRIPAEIYALDSYAVPLEKAFSPRQITTLLGEVGLKILETRPSPGSDFAHPLQKHACGGVRDDGRLMPLRPRLMDWWLTCIRRHHYWCLAIKNPSLFELGIAAGKKSAFTFPDPNRGKGSPE